MPAYKKQHYLPATYLKYFSDVQSECSRKKSWVWRFDGAEMRRVPVESQCAKDYFYSKQKAAEIEKHFQKLENMYGDFVDKVRSGQEPPRINFGDLFLFMADLNLRNAIHKNHTGEEGIEAYEKRLNLFFQLILMRNTGKEFSVENVKIHIASNWRLEIVSAPADCQFATSDNPSIFGTCRKPINGRSQLQLILTPLDPGHLAIAFDRRIMWVQKMPACILDVQRLNNAQISNAENCVYKSTQYTASDLLNLTGAFSAKGKVVSEVTSERWRSFMLYIPTNYFSFMTMKPPAM